MVTTRGVGGGGGGPDEHGNDSVFYRGVERDSLIAFWGIFLAPPIDFLLA